MHLSSMSSRSFLVTTTAAGECLSVNLVFSIFFLSVITSELSTDVTDASNVEFLALPIDWSVLLASLPASIS